MKIKLLIYSKDRKYVEHLVNYLDIYHNDKIELSFFDEERAVKEYQIAHKADVILLDTEEEIISGIEDSHTVMAYLTNSPIPTDRQVSIFKYQKGELIYKKILDLYASGEEKMLMRVENQEGVQSQIHLFLPINGGAGASTVAKAYARKNAVSKRVLYLNMEVFGDCENVIKGEGDLSFYEIVYALKSTRGNLAIKLESALRKSREGIYYYAPSVNPTDIMELTGEEFLRLTAEIKRSDMFDVVVLDMDIFPSAWMMAALKEADQIWLIADGTEESAIKYKKFKEFITDREEKGQLRLRPKMKIFYNKYRSRTGKPVDNCDLEVIGGSPYYEGIGEREIVKRMAEADVFEKDGIW